MKLEPFINEDGNASVRDRETKEEIENIVSVGISAEYDGAPEIITVEFNYLRGKLNSHEADDCMS